MFVFQYEMAPKQAFSSFAPHPQTILYLV